MANCAGKGSCQLTHDIVATKSIYPCSSYTPIRVLEHMYALVQFSQWTCRVFVCTYIHATYSVIELVHVYCVNSTQQRGPRSSFVCVAPFEVTLLTKATHAIWLTCSMYKYTICIFLWSIGVHGTATVS